MNGLGKKWKGPRGDGHRVGAARSEGGGSHDFLEGVGQVRLGYGENQFEDATLGGLTLEPLGQVNSLLG